MAAISTTPKENELITKVMEVIPKAFGQGHAAVEIEVLIDKKRGGEFIMVMACMEIENKLNEFEDVDFERITKLDPDINDVYLIVEPSTKTYTVIVDIAREGISQQHNEALFEPPSENIKIEPVSANALENAWDKARKFFATDGQASLGFCIATHMGKRFSTWCGASSLRSVPQVFYKKLTGGNNKVTIYNCMTYGLEDTYRISGTVIAQIKRLVQDSSFIDSISFVFKDEDDRHSASINVVISEVSNSATGFYPKYKAPEKRKSVRTMFDEQDTPSASERSSVSSRRRRLKKMQENRQKA